MGVDQDGEHAKSLIVLDEPHASHVRGEIVNLVRAFGDDFAISFEVEIQRNVFDVVEMSIPVLQRLVVDGTNRLAPLPQRRNEITPDESTGTRDNNPSWRVSRHSLLRSFFTA